MSMATFFAGLTRAGPGDLASLNWALGVSDVGAGGRVLDAGCGQGADVKALRAHVPQGRVVAVDHSEAFVARVRADHPEVCAYVGDMCAPPGGPFDLIWAAGAVYNVGIGAALTAWRAHLTPAGKIAFSHLCWRVAQPSDAAQAYWKAEGDITDAPGAAAQIVAAGYHVIAAQWLSDSAWEAYYAEIEIRLKTSDDPANSAGFRAEIDLWRVHKSEYGYLVLVVKPT